MHIDEPRGHHLARGINNPRRLNPAKRFDSLKVRQGRILGWMSRAGFLTEDELARAKEQTLHLKVESST